jgi:formylglycine-generating enzyme required for sulfatase activity
VLTTTTDVDAMREFEKSIPPGCPELRGRVSKKLAAFPPERGPPPANPAVKAAVLAPGAAKPTPPPPATPPASGGAEQKAAATKPFPQANQSAPNAAPATAAKPSPAPAAAAIKPQPDAVKSTSNAADPVAKPPQPAVIAPAPAQTPSLSPLPDARQLAATSRAPVRVSERLTNFAAFRDCADCVELVALPGGSATIGSPGSEDGRSANEDQIDIALAPFAISRFPVTVSQYAQFFTETNRSQGPSCKTNRQQAGSFADDGKAYWAEPGFPQSDRHPVVCVSWDDADAFAKWMSVKTGRSYRLVSESEYEYAMRGGGTSPFPWSLQGYACTYANAYDDVATRSFGIQKTGSSPCADGETYTSAVGKYAVNAFGLFDMRGNVWSWTADCYVSASALRPRDGKPYAKATCDSGVQRGGSWNSTLTALRSARRAAEAPASRSTTTGFRVARSIAASER